MRTNVFLRSVKRQPVRALCLALVIVFVTFAFVGRVSEYLLIRQETERLAEYYRAIGYLTGGVSQRSLPILQENPHVKMAEQIRYGSAVMEGLYNGKATEENGARFLRDDVFFCGTLVQKSKGSTYVQSSGTQEPAYYFSFEVDSVLAGYPEAIGEGDVVRLTNLTEDRHMGRVYVNLTDVYEEMEIGGRYLLRGDYDCSDPMCSIKALDGVSSFNLKRLNVTGGPLYYPLEPGQKVDFSNPRLEGVEEQIRIVDSNQHSLSTITSQDVSALAEVWKSSFGPYLVDGRWPDSADHTEGKRVCAIPEELARYNGLSIGDTLALTLRDLPNPYRRGYLYDDLAIADEIETSPQEEYKIVGIFSSTSSRYYTYYVFLPDSAVPKTFQYGNTFGKLSFDEIIFELNGPEDEKAFCAETKDVFAARGIEVNIIETGWENFQNAAGPMRQSSLSSAAVFTLVLLAALALAAFLYYRMRRGDFAKARALGLPAGRCGVQAALPLLLLGLAGTMAGSGFGWYDTQAKAGETLRSLAEFGEVSDGLSAWWLLGLWAVCFGLLALLTAAGAVLLARKPVLDLLQGGTVQKAAKRSKTYVMEAPAVQAAELDLSLLGQVTGSAPAARKGTGAAHILRFVWRHIWRVPVKSALAAALAAGFVIGLSAVQLAIAESRRHIDELYNSTVITLDLVEQDAGEVLGRTSNNGFISAETVRDIQATGFIQDAYLEGSNKAAVVPYDGDWVRGAPVSLQGEEMTSVKASSFDDLPEFLERTNSRMKVTFFDGWDETLFSQDWAALDAETSNEDPALFPVVLPEALYHRYGLQPGGTIGVSCGSFRLCEVAGYYTGGVSGSEAFASTVLLPNSAVEAMAGGRMHYAAASFEVDPSRNRELDQFRAELDRILADIRGKSVTLRALLWDEELRQAVEPLEDSVVLMELLYPVVVVLSILVAAGVSTLFVVLSAKEAAILRVQGTTKVRTILMLSLQQIFTCLAGLLAGLAGILAYTGSTKPELLCGIAPGAAVCAVLYLAAGVAGAVVSSAAVTGKNPLEMLQVKE